MKPLCEKYGREVEQALSVPSASSFLVGAYRIFSALKDAITIIHGPVGCHWAGSLIRSVTDSSSAWTSFSATRERSVIYGSLRDIQIVIDIVKKHFPYHDIIVLVSPVPSIIGDDFTMLEKKVGVKFVDCSSLSGDVGAGMEAGLLKLYELYKDSFAQPNTTSIKSLKRVNIIGWQYDVARSHEDLAELLKWLKILGVKVNCIVPSSVKSLSKLPLADLNIVLGYGVGLAEALKREYGIPYIIVEHPYGLESSRNLLEKISDALGVGLPGQTLKMLEDRVIDKIKRIKDKIASIKDFPVVVSGEPPRLKSMINCLHGELCLEVLAALVTYSCPRAEFTISHAKKLFKYNFIGFAEYVLSLEPSPISMGTELERRHIFSDTILYSYPTLSSIAFTHYMFTGIYNIMSDVFNVVMTRLIRPALDNYLSIKVSHGSS